MPDTRDRSNVNPATAVAPGRDVRTVAHHHVLAVILLTAVGVPGAWAVPVTVSQDLLYEYSYIPKCTAFDNTGGCTSSQDPINISPPLMTSSTLQSKTRLEPSPVPHGTDKAYAEFEIDVDNGGVVRTKSSLLARSDYGDEGDNFDYVTSFYASASNRITFNDTVSTTDPDGEIFRFQTVITGQFRTRRNFTDTQSGYGGLFPQNGSPAAQFIHNLAVSGALTASTVENDQQIFSNQPGVQPNEFQEDTHEVELELTFLDILYSGQPQQFTFEFSEFMSMEMNGPDTGFWGMFTENDLQNTIRTFASVFDAAGNLLPDARVMSSSGFTYDPLPQFANSGTGGSPTVPVPMPVALLAAGFAALRLRRSNVG